MRTELTKNKTFYLELQKEEANLFISNITKHFKSTEITAVYKKQK